MLTFFKKTGMWRLKLFKISNNYFLKKYITQFKSKIELLCQQ